MFIAVIDGVRIQVVEFTYDPWGKPLIKTSTLAATLGTLNPFRYRSYVYDEETGLYYLRSRYYNPTWGRFLNADSTLGKPGSLFGHNVFAYCKNNPIIQSDSNGCAPNIAYMNALTELHNKVVLKVAKQVGGSIERKITGIPGAGRKGGYGYPDVVAGIYAWEIKPYTAYGLRSGIKQISNYTDDTGYLPRYAVNLEPFEYTLLGVEGTVRVIDGSMAMADQGVVYYHFTPNSIRETQSQSAPSFNFLHIAVAILIGITVLSPIPGDEVLATGLALAIQ